MTSPLPWRNTTIDDWLAELVESCTSTEEVELIVEHTKELLLSSEVNNELQFPLFELLGENSFDVIESLLEHREEIAVALQPADASSSAAEEDAAKKQQQGRNAALSRGSRFITTEGVNQMRYDIEATTLKRPKVDRIPITALPDWAQWCFPGCTELNDIQSLLYETAFKTNENMLICAPTGAGKTNAALLTILHEIEPHLTRIPGVPPFIDNRKTSFLIVYLTPMKALATEITNKFTMALKPLKIGVKEYTGDTKLSTAELEKSQVLIATPEKWDVATRRSGEGAPCSRLTLLIIDEVHLLQDDRGPVIEALVARTLRQVEKTQTVIRIVGLSATLPNVNDVANFLKVNSNGLFVFGPEFRPVPLAMSLIGAKNTYKTPDEWKNLFDELYAPGKEKDDIQIDIVALDYISKIMQDGNQILVFVHSRGETANFANLLARFISIKVSNELSMHISRRKLQAQLKTCLAKGIGIHHAGLPREERIFVEKLFKDGKFPILVCTATLAWGVNLPAHTVIIKGTNVYNHEHGGFEDIGILDVHQMFGRAGRPQFDSSGVAVLITKAKVLSLYTSTLVNGNPIESKFEGRITDFLNAEISLGTVTSMRDAISWIRYTYMYQRKPDDSYCVQMLDFATQDLDENLMIRKSIATENLRPTHLGQIASMHYIPFNAVRHFNENLSGDMDESELLDCVFSSGIFNSLIVRRSEISELENFEPVIPLLTPADQLPGKVNILFQSYITRYQFQTPSLALDQRWIADNMERIFDAIFELTIQQGWCYLAMLSLDICKMIEHQICWFDRKVDHPLMQILKGYTYYPLIRRLITLDLTIDKLREMSFSEAEALLRSKQNALSTLNAAKKFPYVILNASYQPMSDEIVNISISVLFPFVWDRSVVHDLESFWLFIQDVKGEQMYHFEEIQVDHRIARNGLEMNVLVPVSKTYVVTITSSSYLGVEDSVQIDISEADKIKFQKYQSETPYLRALETNVITNPETRSLFPFEKFNLIQTRVFYQAYHTDESLLLCAPTAAGKTVIAELTISRMLENSKSKKAIYLVPLKAIVQERVADWKNKFGDKIIELTGDYTPDSNAIARARIIISTPEKWDAVSRGFVVRQFVQTVSLMILDEVHLLGTDRGHIIEAVVDRMKDISNPLRIIGLSTCLSNPLDVGKFLGVPKRGIYNFSPSLRTVPLMTFIRGFPGRRFCARMAAMNKPLSDAIMEYSKGKPTLVFVPSRRQTRLTALDLISYANTSGQPFIYSTPEATAASNEVVDPDLSHCLSFGVGLHHAGMITHDLEIVEKLFGEGKLQLLIATSTLAWGVNLPAHFVVIKGTEYFSAEICGYVPYNVTELQQMMGRAGRPQFDSQGIVMILCEESRKDFIKKFINSPFPVESSLLKNIYDHVNAEISSGRIRSRKSLVEYLQRSYFALRLKSNPKYYNNITIDEVADDVIQVLQDSFCCDININKDIIPTVAGKICSVFYVSHKTIRLFMNADGNSKSLVDLLYFICQANEFKDVPIRHNEEIAIGQMNPRFKCDGACDSPYTKTYYMIQYYLSHKQMPIPDFEADLASVLDQILRILGCYSEICAIKHDLSGMINSIIISQMVTQGLWWDDSPLKSLINQKTFNDLKSQNISILPQILTMKNITPELQSIKDRILLYQISNKELNENKTILNLEITKLSGNVGSNVISPHFLRKQIQSMYILVGNPETNEMYCHRRIQLKKDKISIQLKANEAMNENCWIYMFSDAYLGIDQMYSIEQALTVSKLIMKRKEKTKSSKKNQKKDNDKKETNIINDDMVYQQACDDNCEINDEIFFWGKPDEIQEDEENHQKLNIQYNNRNYRQQNYRGNKNEQKSRKPNNRENNESKSRQQNNRENNESKPRQQNYREDNESKPRQQNYRENNEKREQQQNNRGRSNMQRGRQQNNRGRNNDQRGRTQNNRGRGGESRSQQQTNIERNNEPKPQQSNTTKKENEPKPQLQIKIEMNNERKAQLAISIERKNDQKGQQQNNIERNTKQRGKPQKNRGRNVFIYSSQNK